MLTQDTEFVHAVKCMTIDYKYKKVHKKSFLRYQNTSFQIKISNSCMMIPHGIEQIFNLNGK